MAAPEGSHSAVHEVDQALRSLLLSNGLLEDFDAGTLSSLAPAPQPDVAPGSPTQTDAAATLRDFRRNGLLASVGEEGQATLLGGTLYEYSTSPSPAGASPLSSLGGTLEGRSTLGASWPCFSARSEEGTPQVFQDLRCHLSRLLSDADGDEASRPSETARLDASVVSSMTGDQTLDMSSLSDMQRPGTAGGMEALSQLLTSELAVAAGGDSDSVTGGLGIRAGGESLSDTSAMWSDVDFGETVRTVFSGTSAMMGATTMSSSGGGGGAAFTAVLRRIAESEPEVMEEALAVSVQRVLQVGAALSEQGLSEEQIRSLPKASFGQPDSILEDQQCAICLEDFKGGELLTELPHCRHFFHVECIARWFQSSTQCPLCRSSQAPASQD